MTFSRQRARLARTARRGIQTGHAADGRRSIALSRQVSPLAEGRISPRDFEHHVTRLLARLSHDAPERLLPVGRHAAPGPS